MRAGSPVAEFDDIRRSMALRHFKWDAQVGDVDALASFPLLISKSEWSTLAKAAESLTREMISAETRIVADTRASDLLGVPRPIRSLLPRLADEATPSLGRVVRFDFHPTPNGWRISEANSDVPGGFTEASSFTAMMAKAHSGAMTGDPARAWLDAIASRAEDVALLVAPGWPEDAQVVAFLERGLRDRGCVAEVVASHQIAWSNGNAYVGVRELDAVVRFFQAEWLARLSGRDWHSFFVGGKTLVGNPGIVITSESKRFPLACAALDLAMPTWRTLLPETRDPRDVKWRRDDAWILKGTFGNTGENVRVQSEMTKLAWARAALSAKLQPSAWVAQRRFDSSSIDTPDGPRHVCIGVYDRWRSCRRIRTVIFASCDRFCSNRRRRPFGGRMTPEHAFALWAPKGSMWTPWVKPVLFSYVEMIEPREVVVDDPSWTVDVIALEEESQQSHPHRSSARTRDVALVVDLPGAASVRSGVALLGLNFFPVPLFNALPHSLAIVPMLPILEAIVSSTSTRGRSTISKDANPAFLLDSRRRGEGVQVVPGRFDNRSMPFATDFPSAATLMKAGVRRVVLVHENVPAVDLIGILFEWQRAGIAIYSKPIDGTGLPKLITLRAPSLLTRLSLWWKRQDMLSKNGIFGAMIHSASG